MAAPSVSLSLGALEARELPFRPLNGFRSPKLRSDGPTIASRRYPYYAGFSEAFARDALLGIHLPPGSVILDPWNGSGTTTAVGTELGLSAIGADINPAMAIVARARVAGGVDGGELRGSLEAVFAAAARSRTPATTDPLQCWFDDGTASRLRRLERAISANYAGGAAFWLGKDIDLAETSGDEAALLYLALFRVIDTLVARFRKSNGTWVSQARSETELVHASWPSIRSLFHREVADCEPRITSNGPVAVPQILIADAAELPLASRSVSAVIGSPPYCTRIDYAVATRPQLATLGLGMEAFRALRLSTLGTTAITNNRLLPAEREGWGATCLDLLANIRSHQSKASMSYYYKTFIRYFSKIYRCLSELARVLKPSGVAVLVVQDSYYKDIHIDLPSILIEMLIDVGFVVIDSQGFSSSTMRSVNSRARAWKHQTTLTESVLVLRKT